RGGRQRAACRQPDPQRPAVHHTAGPPQDRPSQRGHVELVPGAVQRGRLFPLLDRGPDPGRLPGRADRSRHPPKIGPSPCATSRPHIIGAARPSPTECVVELPGQEPGLSLIVISRQQKRNGCPGRDESARVTNDTGATLATPLSALTPHSRRFVMPTRQPAPRSTTA